MIYIFDFDNWKTEPTIHFQKICQRSGLLDKALLFNMLNHIYKGCWEMANISAYS
jgi:hypothetical protein